MEDQSGDQIRVELYAPLSGSLESSFARVIPLLQVLDDPDDPFDLREDDGCPPGPSVHDPDLEEFTACPSGFVATSLMTTVYVEPDSTWHGSERDGVVVRIHHWPEGDSVDRMVAALAKWCTEVGVRCGRAGMAEEETHHLVVRRETPGANYETELGRNHRVLVPGLFWWNYWSLAWLAERGVPLTKLPSDWQVTVDREGPHPHAVVQGRFSPTAWADHVAAAESWVDNTPGVLSIREVLAAIPEGLDFSTLARRLDPWR